MSQRNTLGNKQIRRIARARRKTAFAMRTRTVDIRDMHKLLIPGSPFTVVGIKYCENVRKQYTL